MTTPIAAVLELADLLASSPQYGNTLYAAGYYDAERQIGVVIRETVERASRDTAHHCPLCGTFHPTGRPCPAGATT